MNAFVRNIGGSIGIALLITTLTRATQQNQATLVSHTYAGNPVFDSLVSETTHTLQSAGIDALTATQQAYAHVMGLIAQQAAALAYVEVITVMAIVVACLTPLPMIMRRPGSAACRRSGDALSRWETARRPWRVSSDFGFADDSGGEQRSAWQRERHERVAERLFADLRVPASRNDDKLARLGEKRHRRRVAGLPARAPSIAPAPSRRRMRAETDRPFRQ